MITYIGYIAGLLTCLSSFPQLIKIIITKNVRDLSKITYSMLTLGCFLWIIYGMIIESFPIILTNGISFVTIGIILILMCKRN